MIGSKRVQARRAETNVDAHDRRAASRDIASRVILAIAICVHLSFLMSLTTGWWNPLANDTSHRFPGGDFYSIYGAGILASSGKSIYETSGRVEGVPYLYPFRYAPPVAFTLALALSKLPAIPAYGLWICICELVLLRNIRLTAAIAPSKERRNLCIAMWLLFTPYYLELYVGQFTFVTISMVYWAYVYWSPRRIDQDGAEPIRRNLLGDLYWSAAVFLKMMPVLFLPILVLRRRTKSAVICILLLIASSAIYFIWRPEDWRIFLATNIYPLPTWHAGNQGFMAFLYAVANGNRQEFRSLRLISQVLIAADLIAICVAAWKLCAKFETPRGDAARRRSNPQVSTSRLLAERERVILLVFAACSTAHLLLYKDVWEHHYGLLLPALILLALTGEKPILWLPPFLISALPSLFVTFDIRALSINQDPQLYWNTATSILEHCEKVIAPLWLLIGVSIVMLQMVRPQREQTAGSLRMRAVTAPIAIVLLLILISSSAVCVFKTIDSQREITNRTTIPFPQFEIVRDSRLAGPACVASVCRHFGAAETTQGVSSFLSDQRFNTTDENLALAARQSGLLADTRDTDLDELRQSTYPRVLHLKDGAYVILVGVYRNKYYVADPAIGRRILTEEEVSRIWTKSSIVIAPADITETHQ